MFGVEVSGGNGADSFAAGFAAIGEDQVARLDGIDEGLNGAGRACGTFFVVMEVELDFLAREFGEVQMV